MARVGRRDVHTGFLMGSLREGDHLDGQGLVWQDIIK